MLDKEKIAKGIEHCEFGGSGSCYEKECPYYQIHDCIDELKNGILALLKEQEAVKIEVKKINGSGRCGRCPNCLIELNEMDYPDYCGYCGQKVRWE